MQRTRTCIPAKHAARVVCGPQLVTGRAFGCHGSNGSLVSDDACMAGRHALVEQQHITTERNTGDGVCSEPAAANLGIVEGSTGQKYAHLPR